MKRIDITGKKFGRLTVLKYSCTTKNGEAKWLCKCDCGKKLTVFGGALRKNNTKSCGCYFLDRISGENNYQRKRIVDKCGTCLHSKDEWYVRAMTIMKRSRESNIKVGFKSITEFALYIKEIAPDKCPVFGKKLYTGKRKSHDFSPSVDRIVPSKGYVRGNIQVISFLANAMKRDSTQTQLKQFAQWVLKGSA